MYVQQLVYFCAFYVCWQLGGLEWNSSTPTLLAASRHNMHKNIPIAVHTLPPGDEQKTARNM
jgi:hypothetical protein